ncbi:hypothetical protein [Catenulispora yoronensis]|uniref:hypothetical protein n=1 Tax=Catenulispora yoronensis TaxID=450799 RepID=UPI0031D03508
MSTASDNQRALTRLCASLPALKHDAESDDWSDVLDTALAALHAGRSPVDVLTDLGYEFDENWQERGTGTAGSGIPWSPVAAIREYLCPRTVQPCSRIAQRDQRGRTPQCHLDGAPMRPIAPDQS